MLNPHAQALDFIDRSQRYQSIEPLVEDFAQLIDGYGFRSFILTRLPVSGSDVEPLVICNCWPEEWSNRYREQGYFMEDPVSLWSLRRETPFYWSQARQECGESSRAIRIAGEAAEFGMRDGIAFPMRTQTNAEAVISLASDQMIDISKRDEGMLYMASIYFQMAAAELVPSQQRVFSLTSREAEILNWAARGKTAWETSCILGIAEKTVHNHVNSIHKKLDVTTTTQAVVIALRDRQLSL